MIAQDALQRLVRADVKIDSEIRPDGEAINILNPGAVRATRQVTRQCRVDVAIGQHNRAALQRGYNIAFVYFREVGGVQDAQEHWIHLPLLFASLQRSLDEFGGLPLGEQYLVTLRPQPEL